MPHSPPHLTHLASHRFDIQPHALETPRAAAAPQEHRGEQTGYVHSIETGATLDGPGLRFVVFLSGCHFRCLYCHNPDTWKLKHGLHVTIEDLMEEIERYADFLIAYGGGVTLSGGEVLVQAPFVANLVRHLKARGVHVALDTNGALGDQLSDAFIDEVDLWLLDLKAFNDDLHRKITGQSNAPVLRFAQRLADAKARLWVRYVLVPGLTDDLAEVDALAAFVAALGTVERVEVLAFHQMGAFKWRSLGFDYALADTGPPTKDLIDAVNRTFAARGLRVC